MSLRDAVGLGAIFLANVVVNKSGIGGGGIMIPILLLVLRFSSVQAVALSNLAVLAGASTNFYSNLHKRHPNKTLNRPLVSWDIIMIMEPTTMLTAVFGAYLGRLIPPVILVFLLALVLGVVAIRTFYRGVKQYHEEEEEEEEEAHLASPFTNEMHSENSFLNFSFFPNQIYTQISKIAIPQQNLSNQSETSPRLPFQSDHHIKENLEEILKTESRLPLIDLYSLISLTVLVVSLTLIKSYMSCGGWEYLLDLFFVVVVIVTFAIYYRSVVVTRWYQKVEAGYIPVAGDVEWTEENSIVYPLLCSFAGLLAGIFGVGGGLLKGPLMLELGVLPDVTSATSGVMILFTSAAATSSFLILGNLNGI